MRILVLFAIGLLLASLYPLSPRGYVIPDEASYRDWALIYWESKGFTISAWEACGSYREVSYAAYVDGELRLARILYVPGRPPTLDLRVDPPFRILGKLRGPNGAVPFLPFPRPPPGLYSLRVGLGDRILKLVLEIEPTPFTRPPEIGPGPRPVPRAPINYSWHVEPVGGAYRIEVSFRGKYDFPFLAAVLPGPRLINRWPPANSIFLIPFVLLGIAFILTPLYLALYGGLTRQDLVLLSGLFLMTAFTRYMADAPAAILAVLSVMLAERDRGLLAGISAGLAFSFRPSSVIALPVALLASRKKVPLLLGFVLSSLPYLAYNMHYFGHPLMTGYELRILRMGEEETIFQHYAYIGWDSLKNLFTRSLPLLLLSAPHLPLLARRCRNRWMLGLALLNFFLYAQFPWVGRGGFHDMRYFLPAGLALARAGLERDELLVMSPFMALSAYFCLRNVPLRELWVPLLLVVAVNSLLLGKRWMYEENIESPWVPGRKPSRASG